MIEFFIPHTVIGKKAPRIVRRPGCPYPRAIKPDKELDNSATIASLIHEFVPQSPLEGPLRLAMHCFYPWRSNASKKTKSGGPQPKDTKPDCDNMAKQLSDVMANMGFFGDDGQIAQLTVNKWWGGERVGVAVTLDQLAATGAGG